MTSSTRAPSATGLDTLAGELAQITDSGTASVLSALPPSVVVLAGDAAAEVASVLSCCWTPAELDRLEVTPSGATWKLDDLQPVLTQLRRHPRVTHVVTLHGADRLGQRAGDRLLKILEEPPAPTAALLLAADPGKVPATLRSRAQHTATVGLSDPQVRVAALVSGGAEVGHARRAVAASGRHLRLASVLASHPQLLDRTEQLMEVTADPSDVRAASVELDRLAGGLSDVAEISKASAAQMLQQLLLGHLRAAVLRSAAAADTPDLLDAAVQAAGRLERDVDAALARNVPFAAAVTSATSPLARRR